MHLLCVLERARTGADPGCGGFCFDFGLDFGMKFIDVVRDVGGAIAQQAVVCDAEGRFDHEGVVPVIGFKQLSSRLFDGEDMLGND